MKVSLEHCGVRVEVKVSTSMEPRFLVGILEYCHLALLSCSTLDLCLAGLSHPGAASAVGSFVMFGSHPGSWVMREHKTWKRRSSSHSPHLIRRPSCRPQSYWPPVHQHSHRICYAPSFCYHVASTLKSLTGESSERNTLASSELVVEKVAHKRRILKHL